MSQHEIGQCGILHFHKNAKPMDILQKNAGWISLSNESQFLRICYGFAMTQVIMSDYDISLLRKKPCKIIVSVDVFHHAMDQLDDAPGLYGIAHPQDRVDLCDPVCGEKTHMLLHDLLPPYRFVNPLLNHNCLSVLTDCILPAGLQSESHRRSS